MERPCVPFKIELMGPTKNYNLNWINTFFFSNKRGQHENCSNSIVYYNLHLSYMKAHVYMQCIAFGRAALVRFMFFCFYFFIFFCYFGVLMLCGENRTPKWHFGERHQEQFRGAIRYSGLSDLLPAVWCNSAKHQRSNVSFSVCKRQ